MKIKKLIIFPTILALSSTMLSGCGYDRIHVGKNIIKYKEIDENPDIKGKVSFENLNNIRIMTFEKSGIEFTTLVAYSNLGFSGVRSKSYNLYSYVDVLSDTDLISYKVYRNSDDRVYLTGEDINIVDYKTMDYFAIKDLGIKKEYDINELIEVYKNNIDINKDNIKIK